MSSFNHHPAAIPESTSEISPERRTMARRAATSAFLGSTIEYFDFIAFATASALVFNHLFFGALGDRGALIASFATFGVAYVTRPLGAVVFGALGDRVGRSRTLVYTLLVMGGATFLVGLLPTAESWGILAPIVLVILRLFQGLSAGGEQAGSNALTAEHAPREKRGLYTGWTMVGVGFGTALGSAVFIPITAMGQDFLLGGGWRIPFLLAGPLTLVTLYIRRQVRETSSFRAVKQEVEGTQDPVQGLEAASPAAGAPAPSATVSPPAGRAPILEVFIHHWGNLLRVILCSLYALTGTMLSVFGVNYGVEQQGLSPDRLLLIISIVGVIGTPVGPLWAMLSDRVGRRPVFIGSVLYLAVGFFAFFASLGTHNYLLIFVVAAVMMVGGAAGNIVQAPLYTEMFPTRVRYTGYAVGTQVGLVIVGFSPSIAAAIMGTGPSGWVPVAVFIAVCMVIAAVSAFSARETRGMSIEDIDEVEEGRRRM